MIICIFFGRNRGAGLPDFWKRLDWGLAAPKTSSIVRHRLLEGKHWEHGKQWAARERGQLSHQQPHWLVCRCIGCRLTSPWLSLDTGVPGVIRVCGFDSLLDGVDCYGWVKLPRLFSYIACKHMGEHGAQNCFPWTNKCLGHELYLPFIFISPLIST